MMLVISTLMMANDELNFKSLNLMRWRADKIYLPFTSFLYLDWDSHDS